MCEKSRSGMFGAPWHAYLTTGIENCQRTGVFVNSTDAALTVRSNGIQFSVPAGKAGTLPVGQDVQVSAEGNGAVSWTLTSAVLSAEIVDAPGIPDYGPPPIESAVLLYPEAPEGGVKLGSGSYTKLIFIARTRESEALPA